jgi:hypothetical protein
VHREGGERDRPCQHGFLVRFADDGLVAAPCDSAWRVLTSGVKQRLQLGNFEQTVHAESSTEIQTLQRTVRSESWNTHVGSLIEVHWQIEWWHFGDLEAWGTWFSLQILSPS